MIVLGTLDRHANSRTDSLFYRDAFQGGTFFTDKRRRRYEGIEGELFIAYITYVRWLNDGLHIDKQLDK